MDAIAVFDRDLRAARHEIQSVRQSLQGSGYLLSPVRILEVLVWTQMEPTGGYRFNASPSDERGQAGARLEP
jgi:hypothetical protein